MTTAFSLYSSVFVRLFLKLSQMSLMVAVDALVVAEEEDEASMLQ